MKEIGISDENINLKKNYIVYSITLCCSILLYAVLALVVSHFYNPDLSLLTSKGKELLIADASMISPEPKEKLLVFMWIFLFPLFLFLFYFKFSKIFLKPQPDNQSINKIFNVISILTLSLFFIFLYFVFTAKLRDVEGQNNISFFLLNSIKWKGIFILIVFCCSFYVNKLFLKFETIKHSKFLDKCFYTVCIILMFYMGYIDVFNIPFSSEHFEAVFYSVVQVYKGIPLYVNGFTNTYGMYPFFLNPIFKLIGLTVFKFTVVMGFLKICSYFFIFLFLRNIIKNRVIVYFGFMAFLYFGNLFFQLMFGYTITYFQYMPIRVFFPSLILFLSSLYIKNRSKYLYYFSLLISSVALLWNFDSGIIVFISYILFICFVEFDLNNSIKQIVSKIISHLFKSFFIFISVLLTIGMIYFFTYGQYPDFTELFSTFIAFSSVGFFMLPMPLLHMWNFIIFGYSAGLLLSVAAVINKKNSDDISVIFILTIMGIGLLFYYQGRSHDFCLIFSAAYFFLLISIFADRMVNFLKKYNFMTIRILLFVIISLFTIPPLSLMVKIKELCLVGATPIISFNINIDKGIGKKAFSLLDENKQNKIKKYILKRNQFDEKCFFIKNHTNSNEKIIIISNYSAVYFLKTNRNAAFNLGITDLFYLKDYRRLEDILDKGNNKIFFEPDCFEDKMKILRIIKNYGITASKNRLFLLEKTKRSAY